MNKLLSASLLTLGITCAMPAAAQTVQGGFLYIQDLDAPMVITYEPSKAADTSFLFVGMLDANGNLIGSWQRLLQSVGSANDIASLGSCAGYACLMSSNTYALDPVAGAVELVFWWADTHTADTFYSGGAVATGNPGWQNPMDASRNKWDLVTYSNGSATIGFEDGNGSPSCRGCTTDWDWNDMVINVTNVGANKPVIPPVPEPETYAMLLAGLGLVGVVARRRRNGSR
ncbi:MAG: PEP-CTERM sorting domain-containing protein [Betaproteobacteria bacterium]|nr:PEP-CTERM sorting domain-containing protein [Betaproteobacteria bacterium]